MTYPSDATSSYQQDLARLGELITNIKIAMLTTRDEDGTLRSRPMGTRSADHFDGTLYFYTDADSGKVFEVAENASVNVAYADADNQKYASLSGNARLSRDRYELESHWSADLKMWFPQGLDDPSLALLVIDVVKAEFWDSPSKPAMLLAMVKAFVTGERVEVGEDKVLDLKHGTTAEAQH